MNVLYTGYDIQNSNRIENVQSRLFKNFHKDTTGLYCEDLVIQRENLFSNFIGRNVNFNRDEPDIFSTTGMISIINNKQTDLLKGIDEQGSQHLSRMLGVESRMNIHTYNPEILIQKLEGVSEEGYKLKTMQENIDKIEEEKEEEVFNILKPIQEFMNETEERYYKDESVDSDDERNLNLLTKPSKKIRTEDIEEIEKKKKNESSKVLRKEPEETNLSSLINNKPKNFMPHSTRNQITDIINNLKESEDHDFMNRLRHVLFLTEKNNISLDERNEINKLFVEKQLHPMRTVIKKKISIIRNFESQLKSKVNVIEHDGTESD